MGIDPAPDVRTCATIGDLKRVADRVPDLMGRMLDEGRTAREIGHAASDVADAVTVRLLELGEARLGLPPVPYVWLAAGSQGRREVNAGSDQDNGMLLDDAYRPERHADYFRALGAFVCDGLNACGYAYCPGEMMAATERWRQSLTVWRGYFTEWIEEPDPGALMQASVFFDLRGIRGPAPLFDELHGFVLSRTRRNTIFLAHLAANALSRRPPTGLFGRLVPARGGEHDGTLDLKLNGVAPIVELARIHALSAGIGAVNTFERMEILGERGVVSRSGAVGLADALEVIGILRIRHQVRMAREGRRIDNHVPLEEISGEEKKPVKAAFRLVRTMQSAMAATYRTGYF